MRVWKRICRFTLALLMALAMLLLLGYNVYISAARASGQALPKFFGWSTAVIISGSMSGAIEIDDVVIVKEQKNYALGDAILFCDVNGKTVCHRIIAEKVDGFETKGDANNTPDQELVPLDRVYGKVRLTLPRIGVLQRVLRNPLGMFLLAALTILLIVGPYFRRERDDKAT